MRRLITILLIACQCPGAITRTALGTHSCGTGTDASCTLAPTLANGDALVIGLAVNGSTTITNLKWGSSALTAATGTPAGSGSGNATGGIWYLCNATAGTNTITVTTSGTSNPEIFATKLSGVTAACFDVGTANSSGSASTSPTSNATGTTSQASEIAIGAIAMRGTSDVGGTWSNSFTDGQFAHANNNVIDEGYLVLSSTQTVTAAKTSTTSSTYAAAVATFKDAGAAPNLNQRFPVLGVAFFIPPWISINQWMRAIAGR